MSGLNSARPELVEGYAPFKSFEEFKNMEGTRMVPLY
jgi:hypothetical protein